jgi:hypothetical protein
MGYRRSRIYLGGLGCEWSRDGNYCLGYVWTGVLGMSGGGRGQGGKVVRYICPCLACTTVRFFYCVESCARSSSFLWFFLCVLVVAIGFAGEVESAFRTTESTLLGLLKRYCIGLAKSLAIVFVSPTPFLVLLDLLSSCRFATRSSTSTSPIMKSTTSLAALALALLHSSTAMNTAMQRKFNLLADMGLNPDGSAMEFTVDNASTESLKSLKIGSADDNDNVVSLATPETIVPEYVQLPIDNFAKNKNQPYSYHGTFNNRFWVAESAYKPGGPVFIYDVGEADAEPNALFRLQNETSFFKQLVGSYGGVGIVWEHRFCKCLETGNKIRPRKRDVKVRTVLTTSPDGNSTPELIDVNTPPEAFRFLTTEQSLADVDFFAKQFKRKNINYTLTPDKTPWVFVGGSYPAMRAAFMRDKYPDTIYASFASSAPVQASVDQSFYFDPIWRGLNKYGFGNCSRDIQAAVRYMDKVMDTDRSGAAKLKNQFLGLGASNNSHATFADALTTIFATWQSYGVEGGTMGLRRFCDWIETDPDTQKFAPAEGWARSKGAKFSVDRWADYPWFTSNVNMYLETTCSGRDNIAGVCDLNRKFTDPSMIAWTWQYCTQWGE